MTKIQLPIAELKLALAGLGKIISKRTALPELSCVRIDRTKDGWITLTGTDLDAFVTMRLEEPATGEPTSMLVQYEDLAKTAKGCSAGEALTVEQMSRDAVIVHYPVGQQSAHIKLDSVPVEEFPSIPRIKGEPVPLNDNIRISLLEAFECASTDDMRHILQGAYIDVSDKKCNQVVATDGRHLYSSNSFSLSLSESILIPTNKFLGWKEFNADGEWQLRVVPKKKDQASFVQISSRRWRFIHRQIEGPYPNYRNVIPKADQFNTSLEFELAAAKDLIQMINRMPCDDKPNYRLGIKIAGRKVSFLSMADDKELEIVVPETTVKGRDIVVFLNRNLFTKALGFELCHLQIVDEMTPLRFSDGEGRQMIVMPVRGDSVTPVSEKSPEAPAPAPATTSNPPPIPEAQQEREPMPQTNGTPANGAQRSTTTTQESKPALETALAQIEIVRGDFRNAFAGLNKLGDSLRQVQREQKTSDKEVQLVRNTLEKLQSVRI